MYPNARGVLTNAVVPCGIKTNFLVFMDSSSPTPTQHLRGRAALAPVFADLNQYQATMHFNGQVTTMLDGERAVGDGPPLTRKHVAGLEMSLRRRVAVHVDPLRRTARRDRRSALDRHGRGQFR
jgi:hypothetical protein